MYNLLLPCTRCHTSRLFKVLFGSCIMEVRREYETNIIDQFIFPYLLFQAQSEQWSKFILTRSYRNRLESSERVILVLDPRNTRFYNCYYLFKEISVQIDLTQSYYRIHMGLSKVTKDVLTCDMRNQFCDIKLASSAYYWRDAAQPALLVMMQCVYPPFPNLFSPIYPLAFQPSTNDVTIASAAQ